MDDDTLLTPVRRQRCVTKSEVRKIMIRTSETHPLWIDAVDFGSGRGVIGITFAPGKHDRYAIGGPWGRDLTKDLDAIAAWNAKAVVTLIEPYEFRLLAIPDVGAEIQRRGMEWLHLPIRDVGTPGPEFEEHWPAHKYAPTPTPRRW